MCPSTARRGVSEVLLWIIAYRHHGESKKEPAHHQSKALSLFAFARLGAAGWGGALPASEGPYYSAPDSLGTPSAVTRAGAAKLATRTDRARPQSVDSRGPISSTQIFVRQPHARHRRQMVPSTRSSLPHHGQCFLGRGSEGRGGRGCLATVGSGNVVVPVWRLRLKVLGYQPVLCRRMGCP